MSEYLKPQSPLYHKTEDAYFYPLTTVDQVMLENGERLNSKIEKYVAIDTKNVNIGEPNPINADTLGGISADEYATETFVQSKIAEAQLNSDGGNVDLSGYTTNDFVNQQVRKAAPRNLLDNSDFTNPVNQRENTTYTTSGYHIDRWISTNARGSSSITSDGVRLVADVAGGDGYYWSQYVEGTSNLLGKTVTAVAHLADGSVVITSGVFPAESQTENKQFANAVFNDGCTLSLYKMSETGYLGLQFLVLEGMQITIKYVALYEGEYTADNLPVYQPKGYGAELYECRRYYRRLKEHATITYMGHITGTTRIVFMVEFAPFRISPTVTMSSDFKIVIRLGTGGYSSLTSNTGAKPTGVVSTYTHSWRTVIYFEMGQSPGTNNIVTTCTIAGGYLELSADL